VTRIQKKRVHSALRRDVAVGAVLLMFLLSGYVGVETWASQPVDIGGVVCVEVSKIRDLFVRDGLPPELDARVRRHVAICAHCREGVELARAEYEQNVLPHLLIRETVSLTSHVGSVKPADASISAFSPLLNACD
jgi:hypothetical protein